MHALVDAGCLTHLPCPVCRWLTVPKGQSETRARLLKRLVAKVSAREPSPAPTAKRRPGAAWEGGTAEMEGEEGEEEVEDLLGERGGGEEEEVDEMALWAHQEEEEARGVVGERLMLEGVQVRRMCVGEQCGKEKFLSKEGGTQRGRERGWKHLTGKARRYSEKGGRYAACDGGRERGRGRFIVKGDLRCIPSPAPPTPPHPAV